MHIRRLKGGSATSRVQGLGFCFIFPLFSFLELKIQFFASIAARFLVTFFQKNQIFEPSRGIPLGGLLFFLH